MVNLGKLIGLSVVCPSSENTKSTTENVENTDLKDFCRFEIESESNVVMRWAEGKRINAETPRYFFTLITLYPTFIFQKIP